ncbi:hypothetical protein P171DRAFT_489122 [Karstenula rhodostoma CBS 690.94]|uniref:F-box domain-containing protein n=1 Tax=Karstenula rhodostoma CBS 690.94 TaxID=1392251 RepID=A0A9P4U8U5_9PLEO|nr:hypothetical protein P171DRAFT_489122 [Karstenula rhodostoma CBS 690.94]
MYLRRAPTKPFRFLDLPKEIRLLVYEQLVDDVDYNIHYRTARQFQQSRHRLFDKNIRRLTFHEPCCRLEILRACKTIYAEAKPTLQNYLGSRNYHVSCYGYSVLEMMMIFDDVFVSDAAGYLCQTCRGRNRLRLADISHTSGTVNLDFGSIKHFLEAGRKLPFRIRARTSNETAICVDYYPIRMRAGTDAQQWPTQEDFTRNGALQQDIALLAQLKATKYRNLTFNVFHKGRLLSQEEYDRVTNTFANALTYTSRKYWATVFEYYRYENGVCLWGSPGTFSRHWLLSDQLPPSPPRLPLMRSHWIMLVTMQIYVGIFMALLGVFEMDLWYMSPTKYRIIHTTLGVVYTDFLHTTIVSRVAHLNPFSFNGLIYLFLLGLYCLRIVSGMIFITAYQTLRVGW